MERKQKKDRKKVKFCVFIFLSHKKRPNHMPPSWDDLQSSIHVLLHSQTEWDFLWFFFLSHVSFWMGAEWDFYLCYRENKRAEQSFITESEQKSCGSTSRREWETKAENKNARDNEQLFTYNLHPKLLLYCLAVSYSQWWTFWALTWCLPMSSSVRKW